MKSEETLQLLQIMDLAKQWPQFQALHDIAMADLGVINAEAKTEIARRATQKAEEAAKEQAKAAAKAKAEADAEERAQKAAAARTEADRRVTERAVFPSAPMEPAPIIERRE